MQCDIQNNLTSALYKNSCLQSLMGFGKQKLIYITDLLEFQIDSHIFTSIPYPIVTTIGTNIYITRFTPNHLLYIFATNRNLLSWHNVILDFGYCLIILHLGVLTRVINSLRSPSCFLSADIMSVCFLGLFKYGIAKALHAF